MRRLRMSGSQTARVKRFALLAGTAVVAFAGLAGSSALAQNQAARQQASASNAPKVVRRFGCTFQADIGELFVPKIVGIGAVSCDRSTTFETFRVVLFRNGTALPRGLFFRRLRCVGESCYIGHQEEFYARVATREYRWDQTARYRSELTVTVRRNGTVITVRASRSAPAIRKPQPTSSGSTGPRPILDSARVLPREVATVAFS